VYCGKRDQLSEDHVIPQCLFAGNCPGNTPKVYACEKCNNIVKSANDAYLRDMLFMDMDSTQHPIVQQLWEKFARALSRNQSPAALQAWPTSQDIMLQRSTTLYENALQ
jgi:hypothetical protein